MPRKWIPFALLIAVILALIGLAFLKIGNSQRGEGLIAAAACLLVAVFLPDMERKM